MDEKLKCVLDYILAHDGASLLEMAHALGIDTNTILRRIITIETSYQTFYQVGTRIYVYEKLYKDECL